MRWMKVLLPAAAAALLLSGCSTKCRQACENANTICAQQFADANKTFDVEKCTADCEDNLDACKNMSEQEDCVAGASSCSALQACPGCMQ